MNVSAVCYIVHASVVRSVSHDYSTTRKWLSLFELIAAGRRTSVSETQYLCCSTAVHGVPAFVGDISC